MLSVGLFASIDPLEDTTRGLAGLFHGGGLYFLGVQTLACVCVTAWSAFSTAVILLVSDAQVPLSQNISNDMVLNF